MPSGKRGWHVWCITGSGYAWGIYAKNYASEAGAVAGIQRMLAKGELRTDEGGQVVTRLGFRPVGVAPRGAMAIRRAVLAPGGTVVLREPEPPARRVR